MGNRFIAEPENADTPSEKVRVEIGFVENRADWINRWNEKFHRLFFPVS
jgi:hypothetical protein